MSRIRLTAKGIDALSTKREREDFWDTVTPGLCLRVSGATDRKTWLVRYRASGKHRRQKIGTTDRMSLKDARDAARRIFQRADAGEDPAQKKEDLRHGLHTFGEMAETVLAKKAEGTRERTQRERRRILETELLPEWAPRPAASITRGEVRALLDRIAARPAPVMANRVLALVRLLYNTALEEDFPTIEGNPAAKLKNRTEGRRARHLTPNEIKVIWDTLEAENPVTRAVLRLTLLTAQRVGSVCAMRWDDIDDADVWTTPAENFKGKRKHMVPLSVESLAVLDDLRPISGYAEHVFPGRGDGVKNHLVSTNNALRRVRTRSKLPSWWIHDFRRAFRTHATRSEHPDHPKDPVGLGVDPHVADAVLGHKEASLGFDRYTSEPERYLLSEKREALRRWGAFIADAVRG